MEWFSKTAAPAINNIKFDDLDPDEMVQHDRSLKMSTTYRYIATKFFKTEVHVLFYRFNLCNFPVVFITFIEIANLLYKQIML